MQENYEQVRKGFKILHPLIAGYIGLELNRVYHNDWWDEVLYVLDYQNELPNSEDYNTLIDSLDIANCLRLIDRKWNDVFRDRLSLNCRTWAKELMGVRNIIAHIGQQDMEQADAERALDTMVRLCRYFDEEGADEIKKIYMQVRHLASDGSQQSLSINGPTAIDIPREETERADIGNGERINLVSLIGTDAVQKTTLTRKVTFAGKTQAYPVYKVRLDALYYNDQNDRIATWISRYRAENGSDSLSRLSGEEYNGVIENFIYESNPESIERTQKNISLVGQREPGVALADGRIVDGNRRYTCLRRIQRKNPEPLYFETVIMDVDIQTDRKQIKLLELAIQHGEEKKVDYDLIDYAVGTYRDVVKTGLLTVEEYAESTNETKAEVNKRIEIASVICEFLEYIRLPEQFHVAREYQVYSLFYEMMPLVKQLSGDEKDMLKFIVFNNTVMKAFSDQRKFIRDIKLLLKNNTYPMYFKEQDAINKEIQEKFKNTEIKSKEDIDRFATENESITEKLQLTLEKALLRSRRQLLKAKPAENIDRSIALMTEFDTGMFERMDKDEQKKLKRKMDYLSKVLNGYKSQLDPEGEGSGPDIRLAKDSPENPLILCFDADRTIHGLSVSLCFGAVKENEKQSDTTEARLYFVDSAYRIVSNKFTVAVRTGCETECNFVLESGISDQKEVYLVIQGKGNRENEALRIIPFDIEMDV